MGLGAVSRSNHIDVARANAEKARTLVRSGIDPLEKRDVDAKVAIKEREAQLTFADLIDKFFESKDQSKYFRTEQTRRRWYFCLTTHAASLHKQEIKQITTRDVYETLIPIWGTKTETASRTRLYTEAVFAWAIAMQFRDGPNPATWRGNLDQLLTAKERVKPSKNHAALPWQEVPELMKKLRNLNTPASYLTEFIILTASRSGEARGALWEEVDLNNEIWSISAERMKMKRPHIVPLVGAAKSMISDRLEYKNRALVFENPSNKKAFSYNAPMVTLRKLGYNNVTTHGFRSSFKTWALEATSFPTQAVEFALAHETKNTVERAYIRGNKMLDKRREVMWAWDSFCDGR
jgi:integrase